MIFPKQTEVLCFPNAQWEKTQKREDLRRSTSYWKYSAFAYFWTTSIPTLKSLKLHLARDTNLLCKVAQSWLACSLLHSLKNEKTGPCQGLEEVWLAETENEVEICFSASLGVKTMRHIYRWSSTISGQKQGNQKTERQIQCRYLGQDKTAIGLKMTHVESEHPVPPSLDHLAVSTCWDYVKHAKPASCGYCFHASPVNHPKSNLRQALKPWPWMLRRTKQMTWDRAGECNLQEGGWKLKLCWQTKLHVL